jgi:hypothetical protein
MTGEQSRALSIGDRVCWQMDQADKGTVSAKHWAGITVRWDNAASRPFCAALLTPHPSGTSCTPHDGANSIRRLRGDPVFPDHEYLGGGVEGAGSLCNVLIVWRMA